MTYLDEDKVAAVLGISRDQVCRLAREGKIPHVKLGRALRFAPVVLQRWIEDESAKSIEGSEADED